MSYNKNDLVLYRLEKAEESLEEAKAMMLLGHWGTVTNRMYYACFYAITAYFAHTDVQAITHKGIKSAYHNGLIKTGLMSRDFGKFYNDLFIL